MRPVTRAILHHSAGPASATVAAVRRYHTVERGYSDIGYHLIIRDDPVEGWILEPGRPQEKAGAHCLGHNADSVGVCIFGDYTDRPPPAGAQALLALVQTLLREKYPGITFHRHSELGRTVCPGRAVWPT